MEELDLKQELTLLLEKEIGFSGKFILEKQCKVLDIDPDHICCDDLEPLAEKVTWAIKSYTGEKRAEQIHKDILEYRKALDVVDNAVARKEEPANIIEAQLMIANKKLAVGMADEAIAELNIARGYLNDLSKWDAQIFEVKILRLSARALSRSVEKLDDAREKYNIAIRKGIGTNQHYDVALSWTGLGSISWRLGMHNDALDKYNKALKALGPFAAQSKNEKIKKKAAKALMKSGLGNVYLDLLNYDASIKNNEEAINLFKALDNSAEVGRVNNNLARVYEEMENYPMAIDRYERAIKHTRDSGELRMEGWALTNLASTLIEFGKVSEAREHLVRAEKVLRDFKDPIAHSKLNCMWGKYHREKAEWRNGIERFKKSIEFIKTARSPDYLALAQEEFGILYIKKEDAEKAIPLLEEALAWYLEKGETNRVDKITTQLEELNRPAESFIL